MTSTTVEPKAASFTFCEQAGRRGTNFLHPALIEEALKLPLPNAPLPQFTEAEVLAGFARGEQLLWLPSKDAEGTPITMQRLYGAFGNKAPLGGRLLRNTDWYETEPLFTEDTIRADKSALGSWRFVGTSPIPETRGENYLRQTVIGAAYVRDAIYEGSPPESLRAMLAEPAEREEELAALVQKDWKNGAEVLADLPFNKKFRLTPVEGCVSVVVNQSVNKTRVLANEYAWTPRRSRLGDLVLFGDAVEDGASLSVWVPGLSGGSLGFFLSRSDNAGRES